MRFKSFDIVPHGTKFDFVGKRHIAVVLSLVANLAVIVWSLSFVHGLNFGVDFKGGTELEVHFSSQVDPGKIREVVEGAGFKGASVQTYGPESDNAYLVRLEGTSLMKEEDVQKVIAAVKADPKLKLVGEPLWDLKKFGDKIDQFQFEQPKADTEEAKKAQVAATEKELRAAVESAGLHVSEIRSEQGLTAGTTTYSVLTESIRDRVTANLEKAFPQQKPQVLRGEYVGESVGKELRNDGFKAIIAAMFLIVLYVGFRFDFRFSPGVVIALLHDAVITLGYFAFSGREFNLTSIAVILTVVGYSVNDTVVVYDRIRENAEKYKGKKLYDLVNQAINDVLGRTFLTSFATALSLVGLLVFGVGTIFDFAFAMLIGIVSGTYSTWFIAAPMTIWLEERAAAKASAPSRPAQAPARAAK